MFSASCLTILYVLFRILSSHLVVYHIHAQFEKQKTKKLVYNCGQPVSCYLFNVKLISIILFSNNAFLKVFIN